MRILTLVFYLFVFCSVSAQNVEADWEDFAVEGWNAEINIDSITEFGFSNKTILGEVVFKNVKFDKSITYSVYANSDIDEDFKKELEEWVSIQSCFGDPRFGSFKSYAYLYVIKPCARCSFYMVNVRGDQHESPEAKSCIVLSETLAQFVRYR